MTIAIAESVLQKVVTQVSLQPIRTVSSYSRTATRPRLNFDPLGLGKSLTYGRCFKPMVRENSMLFA